MFLALILPFVGKPGAFLGAFCYRFDTIDGLRPSQGDHWPVPNIPAQLCTAHKFLSKVDGS